MKRLPLLVLLTAIAWVEDTSAAAPRTWHRIDCPAQIPEDAMTPPKAPQGWKSFVNGPAHLQRLDLYLGAPDQMLWLRPHDGPRGKDWSTDLWTDLQGKRAQTKLPDNSVWLSCVYGRYGSTLLGKRLDNAVSQCKATYRTGKDGESEMDFQCLW